MLNAKPAVAMLWKGAQESGSPAEIGTIQWDGAKSSLEVQWHAAMLLKYPGMFNLVYWLRQNGSFELQMAGQTRQSLVIKPFIPPTVSVAQSEGAINWPVTLPGEVIVAPTTMDLPDDWHADRYFDWPSKEAAARTPENALQVIKLKKATGVSIADAIFTITFRPGLGKVESDFERQLRDHQQDLQRLESELRAIENQPDDPKQQEKKPETAALVDAYKKAVAGYNAFSKFDLSFEMPDGVRLATVRVERNPKEQGK